MDTAVTSSVCGHENQGDLVIEGIPPHAWELEVVESLLGGACIIDSVAPTTSSRTDMASFLLTAWTADPEAIPTRRWLVIPEPEEQMQMFQPKTLQYKVLIHLDSITTFLDGDEPWFLGGSSDSGQSGLPESDYGMGGSGTKRNFEWQFGVRDRRGDNANGHGGGGRNLAGGGRDKQHAEADWRIPQMVTVSARPSMGPTTRIQDRLMTRVSAFYRIGGPVVPVDRPLAELIRILNPQRAGNSVPGVDTAPLVTTQEGGLRIDAAPRTADQGTSRSEQRGDDDQTIEQVELGGVEPTPVVGQADSDPKADKE